MDQPARTFLDDDRKLRAALTPLRRQLLEALRTPASAAQLAEQLGLPRQKLGYHLRALEEAGLVRLAEERRRRGFTERLLVSTDYVVDPDLLGAPADPDAVEAQDRHAADHLIRTASAVVRDVAKMRQDAEAEGTRLLTLTVEADLTFARPADFDAFTEELAEAVAALARRYGAETGRRYRLIAGAHPALPAKPIQKN
jgi:DNA-binding transcriptional ArsR family regulator